MNNPQPRIDKSGLPATYRVQDGCHNCRWYESHVCKLNAGAFPREDAFETYREFVRAVTHWDNRCPTVDPAGICDQHERKADE